MTDNDTTLDSSSDVEESIDIVDGIADVEE
jgi:hypothetical protein